jgi:tellurite resistance protein TerB
MLQGYQAELAGRQDGPLAKLKTDIDRFRDRAFLKAAMAVSALTALADGEVSLEERYRVDGIVAGEPTLAAFNAHKAAAIFNDYVHALRSEPVRSRRILMAKIERMAEKPRRARTLMRVSWLIIDADERVAPGEAAAFDELCRALHLDPDDVRAGVRR